MDNPLTLSHGQSLYRNTYIYVCVCVCINVCERYFKFKDTNRLKVKRKMYTLLTPIRRYLKSDFNQKKNEWLY